MKKEDLMIGDWILVDVNDWIEDEYDRNCGVVDYQPHQIQYGEELDYLEYGDGKPKYMPITKEIADKNFQQETTGIYKLYGNLYLIRHHIEKDKWMVNWMENAYDPNYRVVACLQYVHELQHILKYSQPTAKIKI